MKRVPYTFPFHNLPPEPVFFQKGLFLYFLPFLTLDKIKVGGDSCSPQHCCILKIKVSSPSYRTGDSAGDIFLRGVYLRALVHYKCSQLFVLRALFLRVLFGFTRVKDPTPGSSVP